MLLLREEDVRAVLRMAPLVDALESAFRDKSGGGVTNHARARVAGGARGTLQIMSAGWRGADVMGYKAYATGPNGVVFRVFLYDGAGRPLAEIESDALGALRTGAASGLATRHMARADVSAAAVLGSGAQARTQLEGVCAVRAIRRATVYSRTVANRERFATEMSARLGTPVTAAASAPEAIEGCGVVCVITTSREPVLEGRWLAPGTHINAAGANRIDRREIDGETIRRANRVAADDVRQAQMECGDLAFAAREGAFDWSRVVELADVVAGRAPGRTSPEEITLFESQGIALEDIAAAKLVYDAALEKGIGHQ